jgi:hypothetical protein
VSFVSVRNEEAALQLLLDCTNDHCLTTVVSQSVTFASVCVTLACKRNVLSGTTVNFCSVSECNSC